MTDFRTVSSRRELGYSEVIVSISGFSIPFSQWIPVSVCASCELEEATDGDIRRGGRIREVH